MTRRDTDRHSRRGFVRWVGGSSVLAAACSLAVPGCRPGGKEATRRLVFRVRGPSMNPSFWDASRRIACAACGVETRVDESLLARSLHALELGGSAGGMRCWHCGVAIAVDQVRAWLSLPILAPDTIDVAECPVDDLRAGDVVLIRKDVGETDGFHLKRILATPHQSVTADAAGRLLVDRQRPSFAAIPSVMVDRDQHREISRWQNPAVSSATLTSTTRWARSEDRQWVTSTPSGWLIYEHRSVYRGNQPIPVLDDYPGNIGVSRKLSPADGLSVQFRLLVEPSESQREVTTTLAFWQHDGIEMQQSIDELPAGCRELLIKKSCTSLGPDSEPAEPLGLSPVRPLGLRLALESPGGGALQSHACRIAELAVDRKVLYRTSPRVERAGREARDAAATVLAAEQWFVVGDNVPLSVDSRHWGSVQTDEIIGRVEGLRNQPTFV